MDSLELVELVMAIEEFFGVEIAEDDGSKAPGSPSEIVDRLERQLSNQRPQQAGGRSAPKTRERARMASIG
jgi:hypothetical protein